PRDAVQLDRPLAPLGHDVEAPVRETEEALRVARPIGVTRLNRRRDAYLRRFRPRLEHLVDGDGLPFRVVVADIADEEAACPIARAVLDVLPVDRLHSVHRNP